MRLAALLVPSVLVTAALAVVRQQHYTKLQPSGAPDPACELNVTTSIPHVALVSTYMIRMWCAAWCDATAHCSTFCLSLKLSFCKLYSSIIGLQYTGGSIAEGQGIACYSAAASVFNIIDRDTVITATPPMNSSYPVTRMKDHVYHPCKNFGPQSYITEIGRPYPYVRFDFGQEETVAQIYISTTLFFRVEIRLGNSEVNRENPVIYYLYALQGNGYEFRVPLTQHHKGRYLSFNCLNYGEYTTIRIGEVRVMRAFG